MIRFNYRTLPRVCINHDAPITTQNGITTAINTKKNTNWLLDIGLDTEEESGSYSTEIEFENFKRIKIATILGSFYEWWDHNQELYSFSAQFYVENMVIPALGVTNKRIFSRVGLFIQNAEGAWMETKSTRCPTSEITFAFGRASNLDPEPISDSCFYF